ncbi:MAG: 6-bladed beta-propeller [Bacteroidales bacterium]|nr:6-bladed beta-propeller [Bacteroidales bacterium]
MKKLIYYLNFFSLIFYSCNNTKENSILYDNVDVNKIASNISLMKDSVSSDLIHIKIPNLNKDEYELYSSDIFDSVYYVPLETTEESIIGSIDKLMINQDTLYIIDRYKLKCIKRFTLNGKYIDQIGSLGNGPGEFVEPTDVYVDNNEIIVLDQFQKKLITYSHNGKLIKDTLRPFACFQVAKIDIDKYIFRTIESLNSHIPDLYEYNLWTTNKDFVIDKKGFYQQTNTYSPILNFNDLSYINNNVYFYNNFTDSIYQITSDGCVICKYVIDIDQDRSNDLFLEENYDKLIEKEKQGEFYVISQILITNDYVLCKIINQYKPYYIFYSKNTKKEVCIRYFKPDFYTILPTLGSILNVTDDTFVGEITAENFSLLLSWPKELFDDLENNCGIEIVDRMKQFCKTIHPDDNPVLVFYKMKKW